MNAPAATVAGPGRRSRPDGEFAYTPRDFERIAAMLYEDAGISMPAAKSTLVYSRLTKRLRELGLDSFDAYCALIADASQIEERRRMLAALTTNVTRFFREPHHFDHLRTRVLPPLLEAARAGGRVRIWSSASSTGEEPYSIALTILSLMPDAPRLDVRVLATDIDPNVVREGAEGVYAESRLAQVPQALRDRWFARQDGSAGGEPTWGAARELRALVAFRELSLVGPWQMKGRFQAIFCRNVAIYFDEETRSRLWARFVPMLDPGGVLYIGHSERVSGAAASRLKADGITTYRLSEGGRA